MVLTLKEHTMIAPRGQGDRGFQEVKFGGILKELKENKDQETEGGGRS